MIPLDGNVELFFGLREVKSLSNLRKGGGYGQVGLRGLWLRI